MNTARDWIHALRLQPHPEGGYFRETYRASETVAGDALPARFGGSRAFSTAIYFLLEAENFSAFHRIKADEVWHLYAGGPLEVVSIDASGALTRHQLGLDLARGEQPQLVVPAGHWFASRPAPDVPYALVGCTVSPGFDFADFEMATRAQLTQSFPAHHPIIQALTRTKPQRAGKERGRVLTLDKFII